MSFNLSVFLPSSPHSSTCDTYDTDHAYHRGPSPEAKDDSGHLSVSQWQTSECDQVGDEVEGRSHLPGDPEP